MQAAGEHGGGAHWSVERLSISLFLSRPGARNERGLGMFMVTGGFEFGTKDATSYSCTRSPTVSFFHIFISHFENINRFLIFRHSLNQLLKRKKKKRNYLSFLAQKHHYLLLPQLIR
jgi:hypothetical protein